MVVGSNPIGSTRSIRIRQPVCSFVWISGVVAERSNATVPKAAGAQPPEVRILPTPRTPHENRSHEGVYRGLAGVPRTENTGMDGGPCGKGAVLLRLLRRKSLASSTLAPSASRSAVIGHGIGPGIQSAKTGWIGKIGRASCRERV